MPPRPFLPQPVRVAACASSLTLASCMTCPPTGRTLTAPLLVPPDARCIVRAAVLEDARAIHDGIRRLKMRLAHSASAA